MWPACHFCEIHHSRGIFWIYSSIQFRSSQHKTSINNKCTVCVCTVHDIGNIWTHVGAFVSFTGSSVTALRTPSGFHFHTNSLINLLTDSFSKASCRIAGDIVFFFVQLSHIRSVRLKTQQLWLSPPLSISNQTSCLKGKRTAGGVFNCTRALLHSHLQNLRNSATHGGDSLPSTDFMSNFVAFVIYDSEVGLNKV